MRDDPRPPGIDTAATAAIVHRRLFDGGRELYRIGRYAVLGQIGRGGMGTIYAAFDDELDRRVAIKLLHVGDDGETRRLRDEARALAQLSHPNVVAVYEVGEHEGRTYVAMEHLRGETLREWVASGNRPRHEKIEVLLQAGRALAAAHAAGLVHRDFKPDNVMVTDDGRVRVLDFGLALRDVSPVDAGSASASDMHRVGDDELTPRSSARRVAGTPGYIAPELLDGVAADARSDQYSFCVMAWELLAGTRPEPTASTAIPTPSQPDAQRGRPARTLPRTLRSVLERGLAEQPALRWPSMSSLLEALARARARGRRRTLLAGVTLLACLPAAWAVHARVERARQVERCALAGDDVAARWPGADDERRGAVRASVLATGVAYAEAAAQRIDADFDRHTRGLAEARRGACEHAELARDWDPELVARAEDCLAERERVMTMMVDALAEVDGETVRGSAMSVAALPSAAQCTDEVALRHRRVRPPELAAAIDDIRHRLGRAFVLRHTGGYAEALAEATRAHEDARALGWAPLLVQAKLTLGTALGDTADFAAAEHVLVEAYFDARAAGLELDAMHAAVGLVGVVGNRLRRFDDGLHWARLAELERVRIGAVEPLVRTRQFSHLAMLLMEKADYPLALAYAELAREHSRAAHPEGSPDDWWSLNTIGAIHQQMGHARVATAIFREALAAQEVLLGPRHPELAGVLENLAAALQTGGEFVESEALLERSLALREQTLPADHPEIGNSLSMLAASVGARGEHRRARELNQRAVSIWERALGTEDPAVSIGWNNLALDDLALGDFEAARAGFARTVELRERTLGPDSPRLAKALTNLAAAEIELGRLVDARVHAERSIAIDEGARGSEHSELAAPLRIIGQIDIRERRYVDAVRVLERALALQHGDVAPSQERASTRFALARALWESGGDRSRALELAREAAALHREHPALSLGELAQVEAWLSARARRRERAGAR